MSSKCYRVSLLRVHKSPFYRGVYLWDGLPVEIRSSVCKKDFKTSIRGYLS